jgi:hypothetical protein
VRYRAVLTTYTGKTERFLTTARPMQGYAGKSFQIDDAGKFTAIK